MFHFYEEIVFLFFEYYIKNSDMTFFDMQDNGRNAGKFSNIQIKKRFAL